MKPTTLLVFATAVGLAYSHAIPPSNQVHSSAPFPHPFCRFLLCRSLRLRLRPPLSHYFGLAFSL